MSSHGFVVWGLALSLLLSGLFLKSCSSGLQSGSGDGPEQADIASIMNPHALPQRGPWFEGWYARFVPNDPRESSVGLIVASLLAPGESSKDALMSGLPGFISILESQQDGPLLVYNQQIEKTLMLKDGKHVERDPLPSAQADFVWEAPGFGYLSPTAIDLSLSQGMRLRASIEPVEASSFFELFGPEGPAVLIRALPLHWFIYTPSSKAQWSLTKGAESPKIVHGSVHFEKNWGKAFPENYIWLQAMTPDGKTSIVSAGGEIAALGPASLEAFLLQIRSPQGNWLFSPANGSVWTQRVVDSCAGRLVLRMRSPNASVEVVARAQRGTFGDLLIPTGESLESHSEQSFASEITATVKTLDGRTQVFQWTGGALEFGGENKCSAVQENGH